MLHTSTSSSYLLVSYSPTFTGGFSSKSDRSQMYLHRLARERWPVWAILARRRPWRGGESDARGLAGIVAGMPAIAFSLITGMVPDSGASRGLWIWMSAYSVIGARIKTASPFRLRLL